MKNEDKWLVCHRNGMLDVYDDDLKKWVSVRADRIADQLYLSLNDSERRRIDNAVKRMQDG